LVTFIVSFSACKKEDSNQLPSADLNGFWIIDESVSDNCNGQSESHKQTSYMAVEQQNNQLIITLYPSEQIFEGTISGDVVTWEGSFPSGSGNVNSSFSGTVSSDGLEVTGSANWIYTKSSFNCSGTTQTICKKVTSPNAEFEGNWEGTWESNENSVSGTFSANIVQFGSDLSGTIDIPFLNMTNASLTGKVNGNIVFFGDIDGNIKFIGQVDGIEGTGNYRYSPLSDEGSWHAIRGGASTIQNLSLIESLPIDQELGYCQDITFDGEYFWALSANKIYKLGTDASIIDAYPTPGNYPRGIAYCGTNLLVGDNNWGTNKIYKLETTDLGILDISNYGGITGLSAGNSGLWFAEVGSTDATIYKMDWKSNITHSFSFQAQLIGGLCYDGKNIWISYMDFNSFDGVRISKVDTFGNILKNIDLPSNNIGGLDFDGKHLWYQVSNNFYKLDTLGRLDKIIASPVEASGDIAVGNGYIWCMSNEYIQPSNIYQIDTLGNLIKSFTCPGTNQSGLAFDGTDLRLADRVTGKIYKIPVDGDYYQLFPQFDIQYLCAHSLDIYTNDLESNNIVSINKYGAVINGFECPAEMLGGMWFDGENFWFADNYAFYLYRIIKTDTNGNILGIYMAPESSPMAYGLVTNGQDIWCITKSFDEDFHRLSKFNVDN
jgi:hypothetical protein